MGLNHFTCALGRVFVTIDRSYVNQRINDQKINLFIHRHVSIYTDMRILAMLYF